MGLMVPLLYCFALKEVDMSLPSDVIRRINAQREKEHNAELRDRMSRIAQKANEFQSRGLSRSDALRAAESNEPFSPLERHYA